MEDSISNDEIRLRAYLGAFGYRTSNLRDTNHLISESARVFEVDAKPTIAEMVAIVSGLSKATRRERAYRNIQGRPTERTQPQQTLLQQPTVSELLRREGIDPATVVVKGEITLEDRVYRFECHRKIKKETP